MAKRYWVEFFDKDDNYISMTDYSDTMPTENAVAAKLIGEVSSAIICEIDETRLNEPLPLADDEYEVVVSLKKENDGITTWRRS